MKKLTAILTVLGACSAMIMGAYASEPSADEILQQYMAASVEATEVNCSADLKADVTIELPDMDTTFGLSAGGAMEAAATMDPLAAHVSGNISFDAMGESGSYDIDMYMAPDADGSFGAYVNMDMGEESTGWTYQAIDEETAAQILEVIEKAKDFDMTSLPLQFTLGDDTLDVNGHTCYRLLSSITWQDVMNLLPALMQAVSESGEEIPEMPGEEELAQVGAIFDGLVINCEIDVDTESYLPMRAYIDTEGSDWTAIAAVFASYAGLTNEDGSLMNVNISVNDLYIDYLYDYDTPIEIVVPDEALSSKDAGMETEVG